MSEEKFDRSDARTWACSQQVKIVSLDLHEEDVTANSIAGHLRNGWCIRGITQHHNTVYYHLMREQYVYPDRNPFSKENWNLAEQTRLYREDRELYDMLKAEVAVPVEEDGQKSSKLCIHCKHVNIGPDDNTVADRFTCHHPKLITLNVVDGTKTAMSCRIARGGNDCGVDGKLWESKD